MKKSVAIPVMIVMVLFLMFLVLKPIFTGQMIAENKIRLGYCPTLKEEAISLSEKNNYELILFGSASEVLYALSNAQIDKALIGRKAESNEIKSNVKETILKSSYTLISKEKGFIDYLQLPLIDIYTYLSKETAQNLIPNSKIILIPKEEISDRIQEGKIVLISWNDWKDEFELLVVMNGNEKVKDFRGIFLYEI